MGERWEMLSPTLFRHWPLPRPKSGIQYAFLGVLYMVRGIFLQHNWPGMLTATLVPGPDYNTNCSYRDGQAYARLALWRFSWRRAVAGVGVGEGGHINWGGGGGGGG